MMPALAGGSLGALLGQAGDAMAMPRNALMDAVGLPHQGSELLQQLFGADPTSPLTQLGGAGVEMATDPLTYLGFLGGAMKPLFAGAGAAGKLGEAETLGKAAMAANAANEANGMRLGTEGLSRMSAAPAIEDMMAAGPRTGVYNRDVLGKSVNPLSPPNPMSLNATTISPDVQAASKGASGIVGKRAARNTQMAANVGSNDEMMSKAMGAYNDPFQRLGDMGQTLNSPFAEPSGFALPGMMLSPQNPSRSSLLAQLNPQDAMAGIDPLIQSLRQKAMGQAGNQLSPLELAMIGGTGAGAVGAGVYSGMRR